MKSILTKKIPTVIGLILLLVGGGVGLLLVQQRTVVDSKASAQTSPKQVKITNLSDSGFSVTWVTDTPTSGYIEYGSSTKPNNVASDDRDVVSGEVGSFQVHHVTLRELQPQTTYYFKINSGGSSYENDGAPYTVTTGISLAPPEDTEIAYGIVHTSAGTPAEGSMVVLDIPNLGPLSTLVKASGSWAIPISLARTSDGNQFGISQNNTHPITLTVIASDAQTTTGVTTTENDQPVPTITLGQSFDYSQTTPPITSREEVLGTQTSNTAEIELLNPSYEGEQINTTFPEFQGTAPANTTLNIKVESPQTYTGEVQADENGEFAWSPPGHLEPGNHTITITYTDISGILRQFTRSFVVYAQGESSLPSLTATPSGSTPTPTPRATATPTPTPTPTLRPTATPTIAASNSGRTSLPATGSGIPVAGSTTTTIVLLILGVSLIGTGVLISRSLHLLQD